MRAALHRMSGEGLVEANPSEGFRLPHITEPALRSLYDWNIRVMLQAWPPTPRPRRSSVAFRPTAASDESIPIAGLFRNIAELCPNPECANAIRRLNDRLHRVRLAEACLFENAPTELAFMQGHFQAGQFKDLLKSVKDYHRLRMKRAGEVVHVLYELIA